MLSSIRRLKTLFLKYKSKGDSKMIIMDIIKISATDLNLKLRMRLINKSEKVIKKLKFKLKVEEDLYKEMVEDNLKFINEIQRRTKP